MTKGDAGPTTMSPFKGIVQATTSNLWLQSIQFKPSQNKEKLCSEILKDKYILLSASESIHASSKPTITASTPKLENHNANSGDFSHGAFPENSNTASLKICGGRNEIHCTGDGSQLAKTAATSPLSQTDILKPKFMINKPNEVDLEWGSRKVHKIISPGLTNLGNTCFMNSVIQCLTHCPPFYNSIAGSDHISGCRFQQSCMACTFKEHFDAVPKYPPNSSFTPRNFANRLKLVSKSFHWGNQEDAHEYLRYLIDNMCRKAVMSAEQEKNKQLGSGPHFKFDPRSKETTIFNHIFGGYLRSQITCLSCKFTSSTYDHFMDLMLEIKGVDSLDRALRKFTALEVLDDENCYKCTGCKKRCKATKKFTIHTPPNVLTIQLKRFGSDIPHVSKITKHVSFPEELNLKPFMSNSSTPPGDVAYSLFAVIVHDGNSCKSGHYYCYVKNHNGTWFQMNDSHVSKSNINSVLSKNAYILFYVRKPRSKLNGLNKPLELNGSADKIRVASSVPSNPLNGSNATCFGLTRGKLIDSMKKKPSLSDPSASPIKDSLKDATQSLIVRPKGKPAIISDKPRFIIRTGNGQPSINDLTKSAVKDAGTKRLVDYSDESDLDEPIHKKPRKHDPTSSNANGIRIFSNSSSSNSVSSLSDHSSRDNSPNSNGPSNDSAGTESTPTVPVMNGSNTVITKEIIHKESNFELGKESGSGLSFFGTEVKSWSGKTNAIDEKVLKDKMEDELATREEDDYNKDFDAGKVKKVKKKAIGDDFVSHQTPKSNPFDSHQNGGSSSLAQHLKNRGPFSTHWNRHYNGGPPQYHGRNFSKHNFKSRGNGNKKNYHRR